MVEYSVRMTGRKCPRCGYYRGLCMEHGICLVCEKEDPELRDLPYVDPVAEFIRWTESQEQDTSI